MYFGPMKKFLSALLLILLSLPAYAATDGRVGIAATVNDEVITMSDVSSRTHLYLSGSRGTPPPDVRRQLEQQALDKLIDEKLQMQEAKTLGIAIGPEQVDEAFARIAQQNNFSADDFKRRLTADGIRMGTLRDQLTAELAWSQVVRRKLRPQISVSEAEIDNAMDQISRGKGKARYRVAEIFLAVPDAAQDAAVKAEIGKIAAELGKGARFPDMARQFSQAPGAATGGDLGWVQEGQLDAKIDAALKGMSTGQLSAPVRSATGYHLLFLRDLQQPSSETAAQAAPAAVAAPSAAVHLKQIAIPVADKEPQALLAAKLGRAQSLKSEITSCAAMEAKSKDFSSPGTKDLGRVAVGALPSDIRMTVDALKVGELSGPLRTKDGVVVLMVCARDAAPAAPAPAVAAAPRDEGSREQVANQIGMQRLDQMQDRYLRDLRATAFIDKRI